MTTINGPRCPKHTVLLVDCRDGIGICPVSDARFSYSNDHYEKTKKLRITALGGMEETGDWNVKHVDGKGEV